MSRALHRRRSWVFGLAVGVAIAGVACLTATTNTAAGGKPIRIGILSDCQGAFGPWWEKTIGGAEAALSEYAGAKPKNASKPSAGITGGEIAGQPIQLVGFGCSNGRAANAVKETRRLIEQLHADVMIGPFSDDEAIAVANYAKAHPKVTIVNGTASAQEATLRVRAPNFFRFNGDAAQWNAGAGDFAFRQLHWRKAALITDDYTFGWTSGAGFVAEFCGVGGTIVKRVFAPLNTTKYSSFVKQLPPPNKVDGYFWAVGGTGLIPSLKAFESAYGPLKGKQFAGNFYWTTPGAFAPLGNRVAGALVGGLGTAGDLKTAAATRYANVIGKWFKKFAPFPGNGVQNAPDGFLYDYYNNTTALIEALKSIKGDLSGGQKKLQAALRKVVLHTGYGTISLDRNQQAIQDQYTQQLYVGSNGKLAIKTVAFVPKVDQSFGGTFKPGTPSPGRTYPPCEKRSLPWAGKEQAVVDGLVK